MSPALHIQRRGERMHRTIRVPKFALPTAVLSLAAIIGLGVAHAGAQQEKASVVAVPINGSQMLEMSKQQRIKDIDNKDPIVAKVEFVAGTDFKKIMIVGGGTA